MRALLPHPLLALGLFASWLVLSGPISAGDVVLGLVVALAIPQVMRRLEPDRSGVRSPSAILRLASYVAIDVVRSNYAVASIIMGRRRLQRVSGFIHVPLDLRNRYGLAVLAIILTSTPGTLWVQYDRPSGRLLLHVLDLTEEQEWIDLIKGRYERLLLEIFP
ncbi:Na+/H+ antiporter subunit E [Brevundimonas sp. MYb46]|nr:Na+/H+ antiporter subunit E [Brevundimonas sp. MYb31]PRA36042.1 Na+/H+ antiporter subunit E [Brevundimonas sp. MYb27]PRB18089.1 Na+/H+ antiporter subunit E [Brevundimonas sp. MYb52]PRB38336.1 Na+/H+ antiporter subunit E [Brevundimonas sp. MYb46]PRB56221.1 Na+/H+ antiporter subunit E [Brevundimonas sp. MYb33]